MPYRQVLFKVVENVRRCLQVDLDLQQKWWPRSDLLFHLPGSLSDSTFSEFFLLTFFRLWKRNWQLQILKAISQENLAEFFAYWEILYDFLSSDFFSSKSTFSTNSFRNTIRLSTSLNVISANLKHLFLETATIYSIYSSKQSVHMCRLIWGFAGRKTTLLEISRHGSYGSNQWACSAIKTS